MAETAVAAPSWSDQALDLVRAASGGLLFGIPLLYTMEMWWIGSHSSPIRLLVILAVLFPLLVTLNAAAGFRRNRSTDLGEAAEDAVEVLAVAIVVTAFVLLLLRQITVDTPLLTILGAVVNESAPFCLGAGVARFLLDGDPGLDDNDTSDDAAVSQTFADLGATALGAAVVGLSIAPTDEIPMLASAMAPHWQVMLMAASLTISYAVVFVAGFSGQDRRHQQNGIFQHPVTETLVTYLVALATAAVMLWLFQRNVAPAGVFFSYVVVLGLPASVGGSVGRLAL